MTFCIILYIYQNGLSKIIKLSVPFSKHSEHIYGAYVEGFVGQKTFHPSLIFRPDFTAVLIT